MRTPCSERLLEKGFEAMQENYVGEVLYYTFPEFENCKEIVHGFSSREGGVSSGFYATMNMGVRTEDAKENIIDNYSIFCETLGVDVRNVVIAPLSHEANIRNVTVDDAGSGLFRDYCCENTDGFLTKDAGIVLTATFADCVPVFYYDPVQKVVGIAHSGWRGTVKEIAAAMVERMCSDYGSRPEDILVGIGPSIGMCCFEVEEDVFYEFAELAYLEDGWYFEKENGRYDIDLWRVIWATLTHAGVTAEHISVSGICTCCNSAKLFSHRATKGRRGTMAGMIALRE